MNSLAVTISGRPAVTPGEEWWLNLEQEGIEPDTPTVGEAAGFLDAVFDISPCEDEGALTGSGEETDPEESAVDEDQYKQVVQEELDFSMCDYESDGSCTVYLRVYRSHQDEPYRLNILGGEVVATVQVQETASETVVFEGESSATLNKPLAGSPQVTWLGNLRGTTPQVSWVGSTINLDRQVIGSCRIDFDTVCDQVEVKITGSEDEEAGEATALAFYHQAVTELALELPELDDTVLDTETYCQQTISTNPQPPDEITCYEIVHQITRCQCSGDEAARQIVEVVVDCPEALKYCPDPLEECMALVGSRTITAGYVDCGETTGDIADPEFYNQICCDWPGFPLPLCSQITSQYQGGHGIEGGQEQYLALYGETTRFVPVSPADGICGTLVIEQKLVQRGCCEDAVPLVWDESNSADLIADGGVGVVYVSEGYVGAYYQWVIEGTGFFFSGGQKKITTDAPMAAVYTTEACGTAQITVSDGCSVAFGTVRSPNGQWGGRCVALYYDVEGGYDFGRYRLTRVCGDGCSIGLGDVVYEPAPADILRISCYVMEWDSGTSTWSTNLDLCILSRSTVIIDSISWGESLAAVSAVHGVVTTEWPSGSPSEVNTCTAMEDPCVWIC